MKILPKIKHEFSRVVNSILEPYRVEQQILNLETRMLQNKYHKSFEVMNQPVVLTGKAKEAVETCNKILNESNCTKALAVRIDNNDKMLCVSKPQGDHNIHFYLFKTKENKPMDIFVVSPDFCERPRGLVFPVVPDIQVGQVMDFRTGCNDVMRSRDPLYSNFRDLTLEEKLHTRPVVVKRISSLLEKLGKEISKN